MGVAAILTDLRPPRRLVLPFSCGTLLLLCMGTIYSFGVLGVRIKSRLELTEPEITAIQTAGLLGMYFGVTSGLFFDRFGPRLTCLVSAAIASGCYLVTYASLAGTFWAPTDTPYELLVALFFGIGQASHGFYTAAMAVNLRWLPFHIRAKATGVLAACVGLSSGIFTLIYEAFNEANSYYIFVAGAYTFVGIIGAIFLKFPPSSGDGAAAAHSSTSAGTTEIAMTPPKRQRSSRRSAKYARLQEEEEADEDDDDEDHDDAQAEKEEAAAAAADDDEGQNAPSVDEESHKQLAQLAQTDPNLDITGKRLLLNSNFWILFFVMAMQDGAGAMFINKLGSIIATEPDCGCNKSTLTVAFAIANACGRIFWGSVADAYRRVLSPVLVLLLTVAGMGGAMVFVAAFPAQLALASIIVALCFGGLMALGPVIVGELFGFKHFGTNWGMTVLSPAAGTILFSIMYSQIYVSQIADPTQTNCYGVACFRLSFILAALACAVATVVCYWLHRRTYANPACVIATGSRSGAMH